MITTWDEARESYDDFLDCEGPVVVAGLEYMPSRILREVDPIAYDCGLADYLDAEGVDSDDLEGE